MNFDVLDEIIKRQADVHICAVCGTPFRPYHSRQKTCGSEECKHLWHTDYYNARRRKRLAEDPEAFRAERREAERKCRRKKKEKEVMGRNYDKLEEYWQRRANSRVETDGLEYGKRQVERTLAQVPKIDVSGFERRDK